MDNMETLRAAYLLIVLLGGFGLLTLLVIRGRSIFVVAPLCALGVLILSGDEPLVGMTERFMGGFADYLQRFFLIFALGAAFGRLMEQSGAASRIADGVATRLGAKWACLSVVLACAVMTYGGVSLFVVGFSVYPLAVQLFRAADLPRRFIPAAIAFGSVTFTMTSAGSPEIQNLIPIRYLVDAETGAPLTDARAGWPVSVIIAALMFGVGQLYLEWAIRRDVARGERFVPRIGDPREAPEQRSARVPRLWQALLPLVVTLLALNVLPYLLSALGHALGARLGVDITTSPDSWAGWSGAFCRLLIGFPEDPTLAIFLGVVAALCVLGSYLESPWTPVSNGFVDGLLAIGTTCSVVGFGTAIKDLPAFQQVVDWVTHLPLEPLAGAALAVAVIAGLAGSASGGQGIALPIIKPIYVDTLDVAPRALHRVVSIASGSLDSLPANGYIVMLVRNICGETHARAYGPIFVTTLLIPLAGTMLAIGLFRLVPAWAWM
jgi:H+/gluconate symporter-like permease